MHHDNQIEDRTTEIKEDCGLYDVGSCPLFTSDVDASRASDPHRMEKKMMQLWDVGSWPMIVARLQPLIGLHRIGRPAFLAGILL